MSRKHFVPSSGSHEPHSPTRGEGQITHSIVRHEDSAVTGVVIVDHGSRREESNALLEQVVAQFTQRYVAEYPIVEPAHMELAEPDIATAVRRCVTRGAQQILVLPYFLGPGRHWLEDIPRLTVAAVAEFPGVGWRLAEPLGLDDLLLQLLFKRAQKAESPDGSRFPAGQP